MEAGRAACVPPLTKGMTPATFVARAEGSETLTRSSMLWSCHYSIPQQASILDILPPTCYEWLTAGDVVRPIPSVVAVLGVASTPE